MQIYIFVGLLSLQIGFLSSGKKQDDSRIAAAHATDSIFWQAYNQCDMEGMMMRVAPDIEFFHDKGGITLGDSAFRASIRIGLCKDTSHFQLRREIVAGSQGIYAMKKDGEIYGVLFTGKHLFYIKNNQGKEFADGLAQYANLWILTSGEWKLARVFSYDHGPAPYTNQRTARPLSSRLLHKYTGEYNGPNTRIVVSAAPSSLDLQIGEKTRMRVYPESETGFFSMERDLMFEFTKSANKRQMVVKERGQPVEVLFSQK